MQHRIFENAKGVMGLRLTDADGEEVIVPFHSIVLASVDGRLLELEVVSKNLLEPVFGGIDTDGNRHRNVPADCVYAVRIQDEELQSWRWLAGNGPRLVPLAAA